MMVCVLTCRDDSNGPLAEKRIGPSMDSGLTSAISASLRFAIGRVVSTHASARTTPLRCATATLTSFFQLTFASAPPR